MNPATNQPDPSLPPTSAAHPPPGGPLRLVLVGRSLGSLESSLRRDPRVELLRARTPLAAVGEAADSSGPVDAVLVAGDELTTAAEARAFVEALGLAAPAAPVLRVGGASSGPALGGRLPDDMSATALMEALDAAKGTEPAAPPRPNSPVPAQPASGADGPPAEPGPGDAPVVAAMLAGRSILATALEVLRRRTGIDSLEATPAEEPVQPAPLAAAPPDGGVPVAHRGAVLAHLVGFSPGDPRAAAHAGWLAHWLALDAQLDQLRRAAFVDDLTGAHNRRFFDRFLPAALAEAQRDRREVGLLALDVDDFKSFNDRFGHATGDSILIELVRLLRSVVRAGDRVCRLGGDELVVVLADPSPPRLAEGAAAPGAAKPAISVTGLIERLRAALSDHRFPKLGAEAPGRLTVSGGLAIYPWDAHAPAQLLAAADARLLESKRAGKDRFTLGPQS